MRCHAILIASILAVLPVMAKAEHLGVYGNVWEIGEQDAIDSIKGKLRQMERDGRMKKLMESWRDKTLDQLVNQPPVQGLSTVKKARTWIFDPSVQFESEVRDHLGNLVVPAGTKVNPLDHINLTKRLVFIDARDSRQVDLAKRMIEASPRDKVILVAGSWLELTRTWKRQVYFDQRGMLTKRFGLKRVPAVVSQKGTRLQVEEMVP